MWCVIELKQKSSELRLALCHVREHRKAFVYLKREEGLSPAVVRRISAFLVQSRGYPLGFQNISRLRELACDGCLAFHANDEDH